MYKKYLMLSVAVVLGFGLSACKEDKTKTEITEKSVVNGTTVESTTYKETTVDEDGNTSQKIKKETTVDPEGLMNKTTAEEEETRTQETHQ